MISGSSIEILQEMIKNHPQGQEDEVIAAQSLLGQYEDSERQLRAFDKNTLLSEVDLIKNDENFPNFEGSKLENAINVLAKASELEELEHLLRDTMLSIYSMSFFVQKLKREQVCQYVSNEPWMEQHEVLTRWAWMTVQRDEKQKGRSFNHLYLCQVGSRLRRQNLDREFDIFRLFLPHYCRHAKREYLFYQKLTSPNDPPDFVAVDKKGNQLGIEITEAPLTETSSFEQKQREIVVSKLMNDFNQSKCTLTIWSRPSWTELLVNYDKLKNWIATLLSSPQLFFLDKVKRFSEPDLKVYVTVSKSDLEFIAFDGSGEGSGAMYCGDIIEHKVSESACKAICKKVKDSESPKINPCILVIYENTGLPNIDYKKVAELVSKMLGTQCHPLYEEVWLIDDQKGICLLNKSTNLLPQQARRAG